MMPRIYTLTNPAGIDELFRSFTQNMTPERTATPAPTTTPLDIFENKDAYEVYLDLPGVRREDVKLSLENETLTISGERLGRAVCEESAKLFCRTERWTGAFSRSLTLPNTVDATRIEAKLTDGILKVTLPKRDQAKPRTIPINIG
jgi:HSP20 family protein